MVDPARYKQVSRYFLELCDADPATRDARLAELDDPEVVEAVRKMLRADQRTTRRLRTEGGEGAREVLARGLTDAEIPERIGPYRVVSRVGAGGMGVVYEAEEAHPRRRVALKTVHPWLASPDALELFRFEAQAMAGVVHPGIPQVFAAGEADGTVFLAMEFVDGADLFEHVARHQLDVADRMRLVASVADVVEEAHQEGLVHRDLKPANIRVAASGQPKVLDFGIATQRVAAQLAEDGILGTLAYAPPEQLEGGPVDQSADLYALGSLAWELVTGGLPHSLKGLTVAEIARVKRQPPPPLPDSVPGDLAWVIRRALAPDPADRPESAAQLADHLRRAVDLRPIPGRGGLGHRVGLALRRRPWTAGLAVVALVGLGGLWAASMAWESSERAEQEASAARRLTQLEQTLDGLVAEGAWNEVEARLDAYVTLPEHQGTAALSEAWRRHAERLREAGREGALQAAVLGWTRAVDDDGVALSGTTLVRELMRRGRYDAAWEVANRLPRDTADLEGLEALTAVPRRVLDRPGTPTALAALGTGVRTPIEAVGGAVRDLDGDGRGEFLALTEAETMVAWRLEDGEVRRIGVVDHPDGVVMHGSQLAVVGDRLLCSGRDEADRTQLFTAPTDLSGPWRSIAHLGSGGPTDLALLGHQAFVSLGWPDRGLLGVDLDTLETYRPHPPTDATESDVTGVEVVDLDGDGAEELLVGVGDWRAYDLRVLRGPPWTLDARAVLGRVTGMAVPEGPSARKVVAVKVDRVANPDMFGPESPFGPPAGIYRFDPDLGGKERLSLPVGLDQTHKAWAETPKAADLDGDGWDEVLVGYRDYRGKGARDLVVVPSAAAPEATGHVLAGLRLLGVGDMDGDGDHEVVAGDERGTVWILGTGGTPLPPWTPAAPVEVVPQSAPAGDASVRRVWGRAEELVGLGLVLEAAGTLESLGRVHDDPVVRAAAHRRAGALLESVGAPARAVAAYRKALDDAPDDDKTREDAVRLLRQGLRTAEAEALAGTGTPAAAVPLLPPGPLDARLVLHSPEALQATEDGWAVELFNDQGALLSVPVESAGKRIAVTVQLDPSVVEIGAGLAVEVLDMGDTPVVSLELSAEGGGGATDLVVRCLDTTVRQNGGWRWPEGVDGPLVVHAEWNGSRRGCRRADDAFTREVGKAPPPGPYTVRVRAAGHPDYYPPALLAGDLQIGLHGMVPVGEGNRGPGHELAEGGVARGTRQSDAWAAVRSGDADWLEQAVVALADDRAALRRLLRQEPGALPVLARVLGTAFPGLAAEALTEPFRQQPHRQDLQATAVRPELDGVRAVDAATLRFVLARAEVLRRGGRPHPARRLAEEALASGLEGSSQGHLVLARVSAGLAPEAAVAHVEAYVAASESPELARERTRRDPALARLFEGTD